MPINNFPQLPIKNKDDQCESVVKSIKNVAVLQSCNLVLNTEKPDLGRMGQFLHFAAKPQYFGENKIKQTFFFLVCVHSFIFQASKSFPLESSRELKSSDSPRFPKTGGKNENKEIFSSYFLFLKKRKTIIWV